MITCAVLAVIVAYMIFKASQNRQSHKAQLQAIQKRLAEKEASSNSPRPTQLVGRGQLAGLRNTELDQIVDRIRKQSGGQDKTHE